MRTKVGAAPRSTKAKPAPKRTARRPGRKSSSKAAGPGKAEDKALRLGLEELARRYRETGNPVFPAGEPIFDE